ncbi:MAG: PQQ-binding-like beta-propeller repeat protein [Anaerolineae bacterium]|nr:PQQ-binding-like beta-propeller repeat protein [Anaerolineae bacterium]NIQ79071.1 PQQ-binding-like beta-propeller repeat protein [Anaerolineae bacterium]
MVWSLTVADLNGDGPKEVIAGSYDKHVYALSADGQLLWRHQTAAAVYTIATGDLDGDGRPEVVAGGDDNRVHVLSASGEPLWQYEADGRVVSVLVEDVYGDGSAEVLSGSWGRQLALLAADGEPRWELRGSDDVSTLHLADLDDDGQLEIIAGHRGGEVTLARVDGEVRWRYDTGGYVRHLGSHDLDHDGCKEIIVGSSDGRVYVLNDEGHLQWGQEPGGPVVTVHVANLDGSDTAEVVVGTGPDTPGIYALSSAGERWWEYATERGVWAATSADLDRDGWQEILAGADDGTIYILDSFGRLRGIYRAARRVHGLIVTDMDGDGQDDVVARSGNDVYLLSVLPGQAISSQAAGKSEPATLQSWTGMLPGSAGDGEDLVELVAVGDIMLSRTIEERMDVYGSDYPFSSTGDLIRGADIAVGNLECPLTTVGEPIAKRFTFRAHPSHVEGLVRAGFDIVNLANNHLLDFGGEGFVETIGVLQDNNLAYVGAGFSDADAHRPLIWEAKGRRIVFLSYAASRWKDSAEVPTDEWIAFADVLTIQDDVRRAAEQSDLVVVIMHLGTEYQGQPDEEQLAVSRAAIEAGACLVIGHHPHVVQGTTSYGGGFIAYSLGNFVFDLDVVERAREGAILRVLLGDDGVEAAELIPVRIADDVQPRFLADEEGRPIVERVF